MRPKSLQNYNTNKNNFLSSAGVKNVFQTKDMEYVNVSLPWMPDHYAMVPQLVEKQLKTEKVCLHLLSHSNKNIHLHLGLI